MKNIKVAEESLECTGKIGLKKCWKMTVMCVFAPPPPWNQFCTWK